MLDRMAIAGALREISALLALQRGERFRARAYRRGAAALEGLRADLGTLLREGRLTEVPGIGPALARVIAELAQTGTSTVLERLRASLPAGALELHDVPHLTLRRMVGLERALGITTRQELKAACLDHRVRELKGFGEALEHKILAALCELEHQQPVLLVHEAEEAAGELLAFVRSLPGVEHAAAAGGVRRRSEAVDTVAIAVRAENAAPVIDAAVRHPAAVAVAARTPSSCVLALAGGVQVAIAVAAAESFGSLLVALTGSPAHVARLRALVPGRQRTVNGTRGGEPAARLPPARTEEDLYRRLGLPWIAPELREGCGEVEAARRGRLPAELVRVEDVRGIVHCHTEASDGRNTIEEIARAAEALGMEYLTITDHSVSAHYADGLSVDRLRAQWDEIDDVQSRVGITLLRGTETDILADGAFDYPDDILAQLDVVIASVHQRHRLGPAAMTRRLVAAMRHPCFKIWGHPLGRYVRSRPPIECDMRAVLDAAAESRVAIEINGDPYRLDPEPRWQHEARVRGIPFVLAADAHSLRQLGNLRFAVGLARRGWTQRGEVLNTRGCAAFRAAVRPF
jgi:DNA polymerase (family 10)